MNNSRKSFLQKILINPWLPYFLIIIAIFAIYTPTLNYGTVNLDDQFLIKDHYQFNKDLSNVPQAFKEGIFKNDRPFYRPLLRLTFILDAQFGENSLIFVSHLTNIILHIIAMCLLFYFFLKLNINKYTALFFAIFFSIHPLTAHTVSWIPGRNDSLLAIFILSSFIFFISFIETKKLKYFVGHSISLALALWTKETAIVMPVLIIACLWVFKDKNYIEDSKQYWAMFLVWTAIIVAYLAQRAEVLVNIMGDENYNLYDSIVKNFPSVVPAIGKVLLPINLSTFPVAQDLPMVYGLLVLVVLVFYYLLAKNKKNKMIIFGLVWFLVFMTPTFIKSSSFLLAQHENRIYLPMFGFAFILLGLGEIKQVKNLLRGKMLIIFISILIILTSLITIKRNENYKDALHFWKNAVETSPNNIYAHGYLGSLYAEQGKNEEAIQEIKLAINLDPEQKFMKNTHGKLGLLYIEQGRFKEAEETLREELRINPNNLQALATIEKLHP